MLGAGKERYRTRARNVITRTPPNQLRSIPHVCKCKTTAGSNVPWRGRLDGAEAEVRTPKRQPSLGREPIRNVKQNPLLRTEFHELIHLHHLWARICSHILPITPAFYSRKLFQFACPIHCWTSNGSSSNSQYSVRRIQRSSREPHDVAKNFHSWEPQVSAHVFM